MGLTKSVKFSVTNLKSSGTLAELVLWHPPQGTAWHSIPLCVDLTFDCEEVHLPNGVIVEAYAKAAIVQVRPENMEICRGSKFGAEIHQPYEVAQVQEKINNLVETEAISEFSGGFEVSRSWRGVFSALWRKARRSKKETDYAINADLRVFRVSPTTDDRWRIVEPTGVGLLKGMYLGGQHAALAEEMAPLCLLSMTKSCASAHVALYVQRDKLFFRYKGPAIKTLSRNREAVLSQLARRNLAPRSEENAAIQFQPGPDSILLGVSTLEARHGV